ncbi:DNA-binding transcriptional regulator YiaG [Marisediminicola sp. UYEF4]|uniref:hypothetical protein n=1 Tax=Marisediminicola sp. UYEF4 TaxID=1756384 RepID=UPI00339B733D
MTTAQRIDSRKLIWTTAAGVAAFVFLGTSIPLARPSEPQIIRPSFIASPHTSLASTAVSSTAEVDLPATIPAAIAELRASTTFTWDQVAKLFGVSRRTVHLWAAGGNMASRNEEHLAALIQEVRAIKVAAPADERMQFFAMLDRHRMNLASTTSDISRPAEIYAADV